MSNKIIIPFILLFSIIYPAYANPTHNFVPGVSDLPVPINFTLQDDSSSIFFNDSGRIIEASFRGRGEAKDILYFYDKTLTALGWKTKGHLKYNREGEILTITLTPVQDNKYSNLEIEFFLHPEN